MMVNNLERMQDFFLKRQYLDEKLPKHFYIYFKSVMTSPKNYHRFLHSLKIVFNNSESKNKRILDVGCGFGIITMHLAALGAKEVYALDTDKERINVFKKLKIKLGFKNINVKLGDAFKTGYKSGFFDVVVIDEVLSHLRDIEPFFKEMNRILRKGGVLYIKDVNNGYNPLISHRRKKFWEAYENGPIEANDIDMPYKDMRKLVIKKFYKNISEEKIDVLVKKTQGLYGEQIRRAVNEFLETGEISIKPTFMYRNPVNGDVIEMLFDPYYLKELIKHHGFGNVKVQLRVPAPIHKFFSIFSFLNQGKFFTNFFVFITPLLLFLVPEGFEIIAKKS